jgi:Tfp pilus assembly protein PilF
VAAMERVGDKQAVRTAYAAALKHWPDSLGASVGLANQQHALGQFKEAEAVLRRAAERHPDSVVVLNNLAQTLSDQGRHAEALTFIERAAKPASPLASAVEETRSLILKRIANAKK